MPRPPLAWPLLLLHRSDVTWAAASLAAASAAAAAATVLWQANAPLNQRLTPSRGARKRDTPRTPLKTLRYGSSLARLLVVIE